MTLYTHAETEDAARALVLLIGDAFHEALVVEGIDSDAIFRIMSAAGKGAAERMRREREAVTE